MSKRDRKRVTVTLDHSNHAFVSRLAARFSMSQSEVFRVAIERLEDDWTGIRQIASNKISNILEHEERMKERKKEREEERAKTDAKDRVLEAVDHLVRQIY